MKFFRFLATIILGSSLCLIGYQSVLAQGMSAGASSSPFNTSVEGRDYCFVVDILRMRSASTTTTRSAALTSVIIRRTASFSGGVITLTPVSFSRNTQDAVTGDVTHSSGAGGAPTGTYVQTGSKLAADLVFALFSLSTTWYVSEDGSVINGSLNTLRTGVTAGPHTHDFGATRTWTLVENDSCDIEGFITEIPPI